MGAAGHPIPPNTNNLSSEVKIFELHQDWDYSPQINKPQRGRHVTRIREHNQLKDFVFRRKDGAILVSGRRGVGKTSTVTYAVQSVDTDIDCRKLLRIFVNAANFEVKESVGENKPTLQTLYDYKRILLQSLIRRLYKAATDNHSISENAKLKVKIDELYRKAVAKEAIAEKKTLESGTQRALIRKELLMNIGLSKKLVGIPISFISSLVLALRPIPELGAANTIISLLIAIVPSAVLAISWGMQRTNTIQTEIEENASTLYKYDTNVTTLESELEDCLNELTDEKYKVVFIIDELDKLEETDVIAIITILKTLFNQSSALFILISERDIYNKIISSEGDIRPKEYTLFTHRIFLQRPLFTEMERFIDNIIKDRTTEELALDKEYRIFRNYICYASRTDFFDLYQIVRDYIRYDEQGTPRLEFSINENIVTCGRLQKALGQIYNLKSYPLQSHWSRNDELLQKMYELVALLENRVGKSFTLIGRSNELQISGLDDDKELFYTNRIESETVFDLINYLVELKFLERYSQINYRITGTISGVPSKPIIKTKEQQDFNKAFEQFRELLIFYQNIADSKISEKPDFQGTQSKMILSSSDSAMDINDDLVRAIGIPFDYPDRLEDFYGRMNKNELSLQTDDDSLREMIQRETYRLISTYQTALNRFPYVLHLILSRRNIYMWTHASMVQPSFDLTRRNPNEPATEIRLLSRKGKVMRLLLAYNMPENSIEVGPDVRAILFNGNNFSVRDADIIPPSYSRSNDYSKEIDEFIKSIELWFSLGSTEPAPQLLKLEVPMDPLLVRRLFDQLASWHTEPKLTYEQYIKSSLEWSFIFDSSKIIKYFEDIGLIDTEYRKHAIASLLKSLLSKGKTDDFNTLRENFYPTSSIHYITFPNKDLLGDTVDFRPAKTLDGVNLAGLDLESVNFEHTRLRRANFYRSTLRRANLDNCDLTGATIADADLSGTSLQQTNLGGANMASTVMVGIRKFEGLQCEGADFTNAIIDNAELLEYLRTNKANPRSLPEAITNRDILKQAIENKEGRHIWDIESVLKLSVIGNNPA
jgi:Cdc6-like AAA superfamily ATPase